MMNKNSTKRILTLALAALVMYSCGGKKGKNEVIIHELSDTDMLNPTNYQSAEAGYYCQQLFQSLWNFNSKSLEFEPVLVKEMPIVEIDSTNNIVKYTFEIREEAKWDNGTSITAEDIIFAFKMYKAPVLSNEPQRPFFELLSDVVTYPENNRKLTLVTTKKYIQALASLGTIYVMPKYIYDPKNLMQKFSIHDLSVNFEKIAQDPTMKEFGAQYNSEKYQREKGYVVGSGPYEFDQWVPGQKIVLKKKKNWWGEKLVGTGYWFQAYPEKLVYTVIKDQTAALTALKGEKLDVMAAIKPKDYVEQLKTSEKVKGKFNLLEPLSFAYSFLNMNLKNPKFQDVKVRQALSHLLDVNKIIHVIAYDLSQRIVGPINPYFKKAYNDTITPYTYDVALAKQMLKDAGWDDHNGNGTIDKIVNGQPLEFNITFTYNSGNDSRRDAGLIFKESCRLVGINVDVVPQEWSIYISNQKKHDFEMCYGSFISSPVPNDPKQIYHTESINGGSNYGSYGTPESDKLIDEIREELNEEKRNDLYKKFQVMIHNDAPAIFIGSPKGILAISKKFNNAEAYIVRPGYNEAGFKLVQ